MNITPKKILDHFKESDPIMHRLASSQELKHYLTTKPQTNHLSSLCEIIVGQQLSTKAADTIWRRFSSLFDPNALDTRTLLAIPVETMRSHGLSTSKANFVHHLAQAIEAGQLKLSELDQLSDDQIHHQLTSIKGIGPWTAQMFLMFHLGRPDVFSAGDLGIKRAVQTHYQLPLISPAILETLALRWSPYRTIACRVLWSSIDNPTK